ncbi:MAG: DUF4351 domain-containing protein, partial [Gloeobacterales cyanobacterium]
EEGRQAEGTAVVLKQLQHKLGELPNEIQAQIMALSIEQLELLSPIAFPTATSLYNLSKVQVCRGVIYHASTDAYFIPSKTLAGSRGTLQSFP